MEIGGKPSEAGPRALAPTPLYLIASGKWKIQTELEQLFTASLSSATTQGDQLSQCASW